VARLVTTQAVARGRLTKPGNLLTIYTLHDSRNFQLVSNSHWSINHTSRYVDSLTFRRRP